jgi:hypothetical protein
VNPLASNTAMAVLQGRQQPAGALAAAQQQAQGFLAALH